ncbi:Periplasmic pH-dependent serine endoprotease DegQ precursor [Pseudobythopirellula maris]|uniref:Periplasmic pH-dependent serine endoprotease DegQ n=1 Tax=Pseudobythopirellula maris TaxID=2527991 RepID=A0A5C5ZJY4_9BACT|nr:trypsin-like peptidase domain-containing protein [Pseudobythopirellula maris]TWT87425.1 Periplasmic pH-dependent serine endoprotease DegQ precursor [Pseudobythopirellula maris]
MYRYSRSIPSRHFALIALIAAALAAPCRAAPPAEAAAEPAAEQAAGALGPIVGAPAGVAAADEAAVDLALDLPPQLEQVLAKPYPDTVADLRQIQRQVRRVVSRAVAATVAIELDDSVGSGVIVSPDGLVLTAGHVVSEPNQPIEVLFADGSRVEGLSYGCDHDADSGMARITTPAPDGGWPFMPIAPGGSLECGEWVVGLGQPNGFEEGRSPPVRLGRVLMLEDDTVVTDVTLVGGDSGGPLLNLRGQVVGIHSRIGPSVERNYHVAVGDFLEDWERLSEGRLWGQSVASELANSAPLLGVAGDPRATPCRVTQVFPGEPAERAGVRPGDLIVRFGGERVRDFAELAAIAYRSEPYDRTTIVVERNGEELKFELWLGKLSDQMPGGPRLERATGSGRLGMNP